MQLPPARGGFDVRSLLGPAVFAALFFSGGLEFLFKLFNGLFLLVFVLPLVATPIFNWYLSNNLLEGTCPNCAAPQQVLKGQDSRCMTCGAAFTSERSDSGVFFRTGAAAQDDGVVEVEVIVDDD